MFVFALPCTGASAVPTFIREELDREPLAETSVQFFIVWVGLFCATFSCSKTILKTVAFRLASAFGHGDLSQRVAERIGRVYGSDPFGARGYRGEAQLHKSVTKANLNVKCRVSYIDIPVVVPSDNGNEIEAVSIVPWPVILPRDLAVSLVDAGHERLLIGTQCERIDYWEKVLLDYPAMAGIDKISSAPLAFYGDEATVFRQSVMCFHWQATLSPVASNSLISRYLISIVPSEFYWIVSFSAFQQFFGETCGVFFFFYAGCVCV